MNFSIRVAGITVRVESPASLARLNDLPFYRDFLVKNAAFPHCLLKRRPSTPPDLRLAPDPFSTENWQLAAAGPRHVLRLGPAPKKGRSGNVVVFGRDYRSGTMYQKDIPELFSRFIDQFLIINLLSRKHGFLLHASGLVYRGKGIAFAGPSGAGKSTLLDLFKDEVAAECLLNDDRLALRKSGRQWRVFGTPWYGESRVSSASGAGLGALFFIRQSKHNYLRRLVAAEILPQLTVLSMLPLWDKRAVSRVLRSCEELIKSVPVFELGFLPDKSILGLIAKAL